MTPRSIALQGIGFTPFLVAMQGFGALPVAVDGGSGPRRQLGFRKPRDEDEELMLLISAALQMMD